MQSIKETCPKKKVSKAEIDLIVKNCVRGFHEFLPLGKCFLDGKYEEGERKDRSVSENGHVRRRRCLVYGFLLHADYRPQSPLRCEEMVPRRRAVKAGSQTDQ